MVKYGIFSLLVIVHQKLIQKRFGRGLFVDAQRFIHSIHEEIDWTGLRFVVYLELNTNLTLP